MTVFRLSLAAFDILWHDLICIKDFIRVPYPLEIPSVGLTMQERAQIRAVVYQELTDQELCVAGVIDPELAEYLRVLADAAAYVECEALVDLSAEETTSDLARAVIGLERISAKNSVTLASVTLLADSADGRFVDNALVDNAFEESVLPEPESRAVLARQHAEGVDLVMTQGKDAFLALVNVLPTFPAGFAKRDVTRPLSVKPLEPGQTIRVPASVLEDHGESSVYFSRGDELGFYHQEIRQLRAIHSRPVKCAGQFSVRRRNEQGHLDRTESGSWFATDVGGYFGGVTPGAGGDWISVTPVDASLLAGKLAEMTYSIA